MKWSTLVKLCFALCVAGMGIVLIALVLMPTIILPGCGHVRLPDRSKCVVPWEQRKDCLTDHDCDFQDEVCAHRGRAIGKCTLIDCCYPWRNGPRLISGDDWCRGFKTDEELKTKSLTTPTE